MVGNAGAVFNSINKSQIEKIPIPLPPLPEQQRIVDLLDQSFAAIDQAITNTEKNLQNIRELFSEILSEFFLTQDNGYPLSTVGENCHVISGQSPEGKFYNSNGSGLPFYQGKKEFTEKFLGKPTTWTSQITKVALANDILMSVRAPVGPVNIALEKICIGRGLAAIRPSKNLIRDFLFYFFIHYQKKLIGNTGAVFDSINKTQIENILFPLPPFNEQQRVVDIINRLEKQTRNLELKYQNKLALLFELKQSILQKAFEGELT